MGGSVSVSKCVSKLVSAKASARVGSPESSRKGDSQNCASIELNRGTILKINGGTFLFSWIKGRNLSL